MSYDHILGKKAVTKDSVYIGKVVRIEQMLGKIIKKNKPFAIIRVSRLFKKKIMVPIDMEKFLELKDSYARFDITHLEFDKEMKRIQRTVLVRESYQEMPHSSVRVNTGVRLPRKRGE